MKMANMDDYFDVVIVGTGDLLIRPAAVHSRYIA